MVFYQTVDVGQSTPLNVFSFPLLEFGQIYRQFEWGDRKLFQKIFGLGLLNFIHAVQHLIFQYVGATSLLFFDPLSSVTH